MANTLVSFPSPFLAVQLFPLARQGRPGLPFRTTQRADTRVRMSFHGLLPPPHSLDSSVDLHVIVSRVEGLLYTPRMPLPLQLTLPPPSRRTEDGFVSSPMPWK